MFKKVSQNKSNSGNEPSASTFLLRRIELYTQRIRQDLDAQIDKRLVSTFLDLFSIILMFRNRVLWVCY
jgi:hypothetical protein